jgi:hypothetical protein
MTTVSTTLPRVSELVWMLGRREKSLIGYYRDSEETVTRRENSRIKKYLLYGRSDLTFQ